MTDDARFAAIVRELLEGGNGLAPGVEDYRRFGALLRGVPGATAAPTVHLALTGTVTLDLLRPYLAVEAARLGRRCAVRVSPFGQYVQELFDPDFAAFDPQILLCVLSADGLRPDAFARFHELDVAGRVALRDALLAEVEAWVATALERCRAQVLIANFPPPCSALGIADSADPYGEREFFLDLNLRLARRMRAYPRVQLFDLAQATERLGARQAGDARMRFIARVDWSEAMLAEVAGLFLRHMIGALGLARKALVLDLDNCLWGGVVGEDGPLGVRVGPGDMESEAFHAFQTRVRALKRRGVLLALCSKNNPADVDELFRLRPDMPLRPEDFAARAIGWAPKPEGMARLARTLNIGLDALVFVDDNPAEIAAMRACCPEVCSVLLPPDPAGYAALLDDLPWFEKARIVPGDADKTVQYAEAAQREEWRRTVDPESYLRSLELRARVRDARAEDGPRLHQMFAKTNQFNLTTRRLGLGEIAALLDDPAAHVVLAELGDRFGDMGIVAAAVARADGACLRIEDFLMSCRAMGRGLERVLMNEMKRRFLADPALARLEVRFVPTARNAPARGFCAAEGLTEERPAHGPDAQGPETRPNATGAQAPGATAGAAGTDGAPDAPVRFMTTREGVAPQGCDWIEVEVGYADKDE